jgi:CRP/FNR family transcriptional regulator, cyclic AMP receptor protein
VATPRRCRLARSSDESRSPHGDSWIGWDLVTGWHVQTWPGGRAGYVLTVKMDLDDSRASPAGTRALAGLLPGALRAHADALTGSATTIVYGRGEPLTYPSGQVQPAVIADGLVRLSVRRAEDDREATLRYLRAGTMLGLPSVFYQQLPNLATMERSYVAATRSTVVHLDRPLVAQLALENAAVAWELGRAMADSSLAMFETTSGLALRPVRERVAIHLLELAVPDPKGVGLLVAQVTQQELADAAGSVREVVGRVLRRFKLDGLVSVSRFNVTVLDEADLRRQIS